MSKILAAESALQAKLDALQGADWDSSDEENQVKVTATTTAASDKKGKKRKNEPSLKVHSTNLNVGNDDEPRTKRVTRSYTKASSLSEKVAQDAAAGSSNVIYVGHLPPEFEERPLRQFLKQFGKVRRLKLARSAKTGRSRKFAFCELESPAVAAIVADTLSGYVMFGQQRLVCHVVPPEKLHPGLFAPVPPRRSKAAMAAAAATKSLSRIKEITTRLVQRERKKRQRLQAMGLEYDFPGYEAGVQEAPALVVETEGDEKKPSKEYPETGNEDMVLEPSTGAKAKVTSSSVASKASKEQKSQTRKTAATHEKGAAQDMDMDVDKQKLQSSKAKSSAKAKSVGMSAQPVEAKVKSASKQEQQTASHAAETDAKPHHSTAKSTKSTGGTNKVKPEAKTESSLKTAAPASKAGAKPDSTGKSSSKRTGGVYQLKPDVKTESKNKTPTTASKAGARTSSTTKSSTNTSGADKANSVAKAASVTITRTATAQAGAKPHSVLKSPKDSTGGADKLKSVSERDAKDAAKTSKGDSATKNLEVHDAKADKAKPDKSKEKGGTMAHQAVTKSMPVSAKARADSNQAVAKMSSSSVANANETTVVKKASTAKAETEDGGRKLGTPPPKADAPKRKSTNLSKSAAKKAKARSRA